MIKKLSTIIFLFGFILIIGSGILVMKDYLNTKNQNHELIQELYEKMPNIQNGIILNIHDEMPIVELNNNNYVGIIEIPKYNRKLPIQATWQPNKLKQYPSVYLGSVYDGSLIIGGNDTRNQFDFMKAISEEDTIIITDMKGNRYSYIIDEIEITKDVSTKHLISNEHHFILFVKNTYSFDYTILRCK